MSATLKRGDTVTIVAPENDRLHGTRAMVLEPTDWGYVLAAPAAATGHFRATPDEVEPAGDSVAAARQAGFTGDVCGNCGGGRMVRNGACLLCQDCATSSGCS